MQLRSFKSLTGLSFVLSYITLAGARSIPVKRDDPTPVVTNTFPGSWSYLGCWTDSQADRTLNQIGHNGHTVSDDSCIYYCNIRDYVYAGVEYTGQCYCGNYLSTITTQAAESDCFMPCAGNASQVCGGPDRLNLFWSGAQPSAAPVIETNPGVDGWVSEGCWTDDAGARTLSHSVQTTGGGDVMTVQLCVDACKAAGYSLAGAEYGGQCYCDNVYLSTAGPASDQTTCSMTCNGKATEWCGGPGRMNLYSYGGSTPVAVTPTSAAPVPSATVALPSAWNSLGCYTDSTAKRALANYRQAAQMTVEICISLCSQSGFSIAGLEFGGECYCDNAIQNNQGLAPDGNAGCNMPCAGEAGETCGGANRLNVYASGPGWVGLGCFSDQQYARTLASLGPYDGGLTIEKCLASCHAAGFAYAGLEYMNECHCGSAFANGGGPAPDGNAGCYMPCDGNQNQICGGANRLSMFEYINADGSIPTAPVASPTSSPTTSPSVGPTALPASWTYQGCYVDNAHGRILPQQNPDSGSLTIESCIATCSAAGYTVAGLEYSSQCFCGSQIIAGGVIASADSQCAMTCSGAASEVCGGPDRMSIYSTGTLQVAQPPATQTTGLPSGWTYAGCLSDNAGSRSLPHQVNLHGTNSATNCITACAAAGYTASGVEYSDECYCGNPSDVTAAGATTQDESGCNMVCSGDSTKICGGPGRLSYYTSS